MPLKALPVIKSINIRILEYVSYVLYFFFMLAHAHNMNIMQPNIDFNLKHNYKEITVWLFSYSTLSADIHSSNNQYQRRDIPKSRLFDISEKYIIMNYFE